MSRYAYFFVFILFAGLQLRCASDGSSRNSGKAVVNNTAELLALLPALERDAYMNWSRSLIKKCDVSEIFLVPQAAQGQPGVDLGLLKAQTEGTPVLTAPNSTTFAVLGAPQQHHGTALTRHTVTTTQLGLSSRLELVAELSNGVCQLSANGTAVERVELASSVPVIAHHDVSKYMHYSAQTGKWEPTRFAVKARPIKASGEWVALPTDFAIATAASLSPTRFNDQLAPQFVSDRLSLKGVTEAQRYFPLSWDTHRSYAIEFRIEGDVEEADAAAAVQHPSLHFHFSLPGAPSGLHNSLLGRAAQVKPLLAGGKNVIELRWHFGNGLSVTQKALFDGSVTRGGFVSLQAMSGLPMAASGSGMSAGHCLASRLSGARALYRWSPSWAYYEHVAAPCLARGAVEPGFASLLQTDKNFRAIFLDLLERLPLNDKTNISGWELFLKNMAASFHDAGVNPGKGFDPELRLRVTSKIAEEYDIFMKLGAELGLAHALREVGADLARLVVMTALKGQPALEPAVKKDVLISAARSRGLLRSSFSRLVEAWGHDLKNVVLRSKFAAIAKAPASHFSDLQLIHAELRALGLNEVAEYRIASLYQYDPIPFDRVESWKSTLRSLRRFLDAEAARAIELDGSGAGAHHQAKINLAQLAFENTWSELSFTLIEKYARMARFISRCGALPDTSRRLQCAGANLSASRGAMMAPGQRDRLGTFVDFYESKLAAMPPADVTQTRIATAFFSSIWGLCSNEAYNSKSKQLGVLVGRHAGNPALSKNHDFRILLELTVANCY